MRVAQVERQRVHVAQVEHQLLVGLGDASILKRAERGRRACVEEDDRRRDVDAGQHRSGARQIVGQFLWQVGEGAEVVLLGDDAA